VNTSRKRRRRDADIRSAAAAARRRRRTASARHAGCGFLLVSCRPMDVRHTIDVRDWLLESVPVTTTARCVYMWGTRFIADGCYFWTGQLLESKAAGVGRRDVTACQPSDIVWAALGKLKWLGGQMCACRIIAASQAGRRLGVSGRLKMRDEWSYAESRYVVFKLTKLLALSKLCNYFCYFIAL